MAVIISSVANFFQWLIPVCKIIFVGADITFQDLLKITSSVVMITCEVADVITYLVVKITF